MQVRDGLNLAIRGYGLFLVIDAARLLVNGIIEFLFGDFGFGIAFRTTLNAGFVAFLGLILMTRAIDILRFMGLGEPTADAPPRDSGSPTPTA